MSASGVICLIEDKLVPGILAAVQKYSTFGSLIILNLNCAGEARSNLVGCLDNASVVVILLFIQSGGRLKKRATKSRPFKSSTFK